MRTEEFEQKVMECMLKTDQKYARYARSKGLTYMGLRVLECVYLEDGQCTQKSISEELTFPKQSVNVIVKDFLERKYVILKEISEDRRNKRISLTEEGKAYAKKILGPLWEIEREAEEMLTIQEREEFVRILSSYTEVYIKGVNRLLEESAAKSHVRGSY